MCNDYTTQGGGKISTLFSFMAIEKFIRGKVDSCHHDGRAANTRRLQAVEYHEKHWQEELLVDGFEDFNNPVHNDEHDNSEEKPVDVEFISHVVFLSSLPSEPSQKPR